MPAANPMTITPMISTKSTAQKIRTAAETTSRTTKARATTRSESRCWSAVPASTPPIAGSPIGQALHEVDVPVGRLGDRGQAGDDHDGRQRGAGGLALLVTEPEHEQRHHHGPAADAEQSAEGARRRGYRREAHEP